MNHQTLHGASDISAHIGALELSAINAFEDGALETSVQAGPGPTFPPMCIRIDDSELEATVHAGPSTHLRRSTVCLNIDDRALEASIQAGPSPTMPGYPGCRFRIDDGELEATVHAGPSTHLRRSTVCLNIDDRALEASIQAGPSPTMPGYPGCRFRIDDSELEATVQAGPNAQVTLLRNSRRGCEFVDVKDDALEASALSMGPPPAPTMNLQCLTRVSCGRIDDGALEATVQVGPSTMPPACRFRIDDSVLEAAVQAGPQRPTAIRLPGGCLPGVDDGALEASVATVYAGPTGMTCPPPQTLRPMCRYIDDAALETAAAHADVGPPPTSIRFPDGGCNGR